MSPGLPYPEEEARRQTRGRLAREALRENEHEEEEEDAMRKDAGLKEKKMMFRHWDNFVPVHEAEARKVEDGSLYHDDHFAHMKPASEENQRTLYGTEWRRTKPEAHYRYGVHKPDHPDYFTSVGSADTRSGESVLGYKGGDERHFHEVNEGWLGDHLVGGADKMVPLKASDRQQGKEFYVGGVEGNVAMARQKEEDGLIGDRVWALPKGSYKNRRIMYGGLEDYAGDKKLGFGDQLVPLPEAIKQQWGAGGWPGKHTHHLADFVVAVNPSGDPHALGTHPFKVREMPYGDGKTDD